VQQPPELRPRTHSQSSSFCDVGVNIAGVTGTRTEASHTLSSHKFSGVGICIAGIIATRTEASHILSSHKFLWCPCRDRSNRQVLDRRGDGATATSSNAGMRIRGSEDAMPPVDPEHVAKATALLEQFKAKHKPQAFELKVSSLMSLKHSITALQLYKANDLNSAAFSACVSQEV